MVSLTERPEQPHLTARSAPPFSASNLACAALARRMPLLQTLHLESSHRPLLALALSDSRTQPHRGRRRCPPSPTSRLFGCGQSTTDHQQAALTHSAEQNLNPQVKFETHITNSYITHSPSTMAEDSQSEAKTLASGEAVKTSKSSKDEVRERKRREKRKKRLLKEAEKAEKKGVCYLSRIPPKMDPLKLRQLLSPYGEIQRIYLTPEDPSAQMRRKQFGGFRGQGFSEGWVEFADKRTAKRVANMLNGEQIVYPELGMGKTVKVRSTEWEFGIGRQVKLIDPSSLPLFRSASSGVALCQRTWIGASVEVPNPTKCLEPSP
ncbi:hypothetical protein Cgig2_023882 [Carnegiea gigantea]|uniref:RRM domain-containing protein n=1 Tax=Carnegiea gigantea TaxID=171969 RepID=A0A9Q1JNK7_9CARY|nr:hypothetical protein Cgig2_023882 [Carnegiea gigantea]